MIHPPFYLWQKLCLKDAPGLKCLWDLSPEQEATLGQINQNLPYNLTKIHSTAHLLISVMQKN